MFCCLLDRFADTLLASALFFELPRLNEVDDPLIGPVEVEWFVRSASSPLSTSASGRYGFVSPDRRGCVALSLLVEVLEARALLVVPEV